jgi:hypothetical protein
VHGTGHVQFCPKTKDTKIVEIDGSVSPTGGMRLYN